MQQKLTDTLPLALGLLGMLFPLVETLSPLSLPN